MITGELKGILSIKLKSRNDGYTDQFNRIFVVKIMLICSLVMGISWYKESMNCIVAEGGPSNDFVKPACWIQGLYIYEELENKPEFVFYYGIPQSIIYDGLYPTGSLCVTKDRQGRPRPECKPMTKKFFLQYQYMPFYVAALAICYYLPYLFHLYCNNDLISLKKTLKAGDADANVIVKSYFNHASNPVLQLRLRVVLNVVVKIMYLAANLVAFIGTDKILSRKFKRYGQEWVKWSQLDNTLRHNYMGLRDSPKPGNALLPPFGLCQIREQAQDIKTTMNNGHTVLCEVSQNILYQYCLIVIWFTIVTGIIVSCIGLLAKLFEHIITVLFVQHRCVLVRKLYKVLTLRECEYLEFIRRRDLPLYVEIVKKIKEENFGTRKRSNGNEDLPYNETPPPGFNEALSACL